MKKVLIVAAVALTLSACTQQERARNWGATETKNLPNCTKLVNLTWKEDADLWILTRPMRTGEKPERHEFTRDTALGGEWGKIVIQESASQCPPS